MNLNEKRTSQSQRVAFKSYKGDTYDNYEKVSSKIIYMNVSLLHFI